MIHPTTWTMAAEDANGPGGLSDQETTISPSCKGAIFIVIGEPLSNVHKDLILERISTGLNSWEDTSVLAAAVANAAVDDTNNGEKIITHGTEELHLDILVNPQLLTLKNKLRSFMLTNAKNRYIQYSGHALQGSGEWFLQDDRFSFGNFAALMKEPDVANALKQQEGGTLTIQTFAQGEWHNNTIKKHSFSKSLNVTLNPEKKENSSDGVQEFVNYLSGHISVKTVKDILQSSDVVGNIRFSRPTLYIFPGCEGDSALFGISGFNLLVNGGYSRKACFWDFTRHLDRIDAMLLTHLGADNILGINSVVDRKAMDNVHPELGFLYFNCVEKTKHSPNGDSHPENGGSHKEASLLINLMEEGDRLVENMRNIGQVSHPCAGVIANKTVAPVNLYHKVGHGTLDMYILNPIQDSKDMKEFFSQWNKRVNDFTSTKSVIKVGGVDKPIPLPDMMSICALLVWRPSNPTEKITRILFPGNAPQNKIFEGLDLLKNLDILQHATCSEKSLHQPKGGPRKTSNASILKGKPAAKKTTPPPSAAGKPEPKKLTKSPSPAKTEKVTKDIKNNKKIADKGKVNGKPEKSGTVKSSPSSTKSSTPTSTPVPAATPTSEPPKVEQVEVKKKDIKQEEVEVKKEPEIVPPAPVVDAVPATGTNADIPVTESTEPKTETLPTQDLLGDLAPTDAPSSPKPAWSSPTVEETQQPPVADLLGDEAPEADAATVAKDEASMPEADQSSEPVASPEALPEPVDMSSEVPQALEAPELIPEEKQPTVEQTPEIQPEPAEEKSIPDKQEEQTEADQDIINPVVEAQQENAPPSDPSPVEMGQQQLEELGIFDAGGEKDVDTALGQDQIPKQDISQQMMEDLGIFEDKGAGEPAPDAQVCPPGALNGQDLADLGIYDEPEPASAPAAEPAVFGGEVPEGLPLPEEPVIGLQQPEDCFSLQQSEEEPRPTEKVELTSPDLNECPQESVETQEAEKVDDQKVLPSPFEDEEPEQMSVNEVEEPVKEIENEEQGIVDEVKEPEKKVETEEEQPIIDEEPEQMSVHEVEEPTKKTEDEEQPIIDDALVPEEPVIDMHQQEDCFHQDQNEVETQETEKVDLDVPDKEEQLIPAEVTEKPEESESVSENVEEEPMKTLNEEAPPESEVISHGTHPDTMAETFEDQSPMGFSNDIEDPPTEQEVTPPMSPKPQDPVGEVDELQAEIPYESNVDREPVVQSSQDLEEDNEQLGTNGVEPMVDIQKDNLEAASQEFGGETEENKEQEPQEIAAGMTDSLEATENIPQDETDFIGQPNPLEPTNPLAQPDLVESEQTDNSIQDQTDDVSEREEDSLNQDYPGTFAHPGMNTNGSADPKIPEPTPFSLLDGPTSLPPLDCAQPNTNPFFGVSEENDQSKTIPDSNGAMGHHIGVRPDLVEDLDVADRDSLERDMAENFDPLKSWGTPMGLPAPTPSGGASGDKKAPASKRADLNKTGKGDATKKADPKKAPSAASRTSAATKKPAPGATRTTKTPAEKKDNAKKTDTVAPKRTTSAPIKKTRPATAPTKTASKTDASIASESKGSKRPATASSTAKVEKPKPLAPVVPCYMDLTYVPNHADPHYVDLDFFRRIRARYYVLSALNPSPSIFNALLEAKQTWDNPELEVTIIPTYDTDALRQWMNLHRDDLSQHKIDVAPSASRCTIQLQDHETSCSAYRLEF